MLQKLWFEGKHITSDDDNDYGEDDYNDDDKGNYNDNDKDNDKDDTALIEVFTTQVWGQARRRLPRLESPTERGNTLG